jgi:hypothetical protein
VECFKPKLFAELRASLTLAGQVLGVYPSTIRRKVLRELYLPQLSSTYLFEGTSKRFLDNLLAEARLEVYLPNVSPCFMRFCRRMAFATLCLGSAIIFGLCHGVLPLCLGYAIKFSSCATLCLRSARHLVWQWGISPYTCLNLSPYVRERLPLLSACVLYISLSSFQKSPESSSTHRRYS